MLQQIFEGSTDKQHFFDDKEICWLHGTLLCNKLGFTNPSAAIQLHTDEDERQRVDFNGKSTWFVSEPGVWGLILAAKTAPALEFKRRLKHEILPKLRADRFVALKEANQQDLAKAQEQLTAMQNTIAQVEEEKAVIAERNLVLLVREKKKPLKLAYPCNFSKTYGLSIVVDPWYHEHAQYSWYVPKDRGHQEDCFEKLLKKWIHGSAQMSNWDIPTYEDLWNNWQHKECFVYGEYVRWLNDISSGIQAPTLFLAEWTDEVFLDLFCADSGIPKRHAKLEMKDEKKFRSLLMYQ